MNAPETTAARLREPSAGAGSYPQRAGCGVMSRSGFALTSRRGDEGGRRLSLQRPALAEFGVLEAWYLHTYPGRDNPVYQFDPKTKAVFAKAVAKAEHTTSETLLLKSCRRDVDGGWRFFEEPPVLTRMMTIPPENR